MRALRDSVTEWVPATRTKWSTVAQARSTP